MTCVGSNGRVDNFRGCIRMADRRTNLLKFETSFVGNLWKVLPRVNYRRNYPFFLNEHHYQSSDLDVEAKLKW